MSIERDRHVSYFVSRTLAIAGVGLNVGIVVGSLAYGHSSGAGNIASAVWCAFIYWAVVVVEMRARIWLLESRTHAELTERFQETMRSVEQQLDQRLQDHLKM